MAIKMAVIGECMIELSEHQDGIVRHFGGDTLNTAIYLGRSNPQVQVQYVTALGCDKISDDMLQQWQQEGVNTDLVQRIEGKLPGLYLIETDAAGERTFHYWRNDAAARYWLRAPQAETVCQALQGFDYIYLSGISLAILPAEDRALLMTLLADARQHGARIAFDNNYRPRLWSSVADARQAYRDILALTDIAFLTFDDEVALWGDQQESEAIARTRSLGVAEIVIKRGAAPCQIVLADEQFDIAALALAKEQIVDTTAAGDSFSAGYLATRLAGHTVSESAHYAHLLAGTVIQHRGAIMPVSAMPTSLVGNEANHVTLA
ncbi:sugar kinase [Aeromonas veronii]|nr:sugar kinase [Aeromonas veronii]